MIEWNILEVYKKGATSPLRMTVIVTYERWPKLFVRYSPAVCDRKLKRGGGCLFIVTATVVREDRQNSGNARIPNIDIISACGRTKMDGLTSP